MENYPSGISGLCSDSRKVKPGYVFFALPGIKCHGSAFIKQALNMGAILAVTDDPEVAPSERVLRVANVREEMERWADAVYGPMPDNLLLVTGSNGKTSVVDYCLQMLSALGRPAASLGTLGCKTSIEVPDVEGFDLTTPDFLTLRKNLSTVKASGINHAALEASSHALEQGRFHGICGTALGFTSFAAEHLDYHCTEERYLQAKLKLFYLNPNSPLVVHSNLLSLLPQDVRNRDKLLVLGDKIRVVPLSSSLAGQRLLVIHPEGELDFFTPILGSYQASNLLLAAALVSLAGMSWGQIAGFLPKLRSPPGRLERVADNIFIDFAHNAEGMEKLLCTFEQFRSEGKKIWVVFGCGGNRDALKRKLMGEIAQRRADYVIVTDDNPRLEDPAKIRAEIIKGCPKAKEIPCRAEAIRHAIRFMSKEDIVLIAGKGHEQYQIVGQETIPFSDMQEALKATLQSA